MTAAAGVALALLALVAGGAWLGWKGVLFAATLVVFCLLLQMSRLMRVMQAAGRAPLGAVDDATALAAQLRAGMPLADLIARTGSLGTKLPAADTYRWADALGTTLDVRIARGRVTHWEVGPGPAAP